MSLTYHRVVPSTFVPRYTVKHDGRLAGVIFRPSRNGAWVFRAKYNLGADELREIAAEMDLLRVNHDKRQ